jgi:hypothetical protein
MHKVFSEIVKSTEGKYSNGVLYAGAVGLILSDIIPTPADALYFYTEKKLRDKWKAGEITPQKYWSRTASAYYLYNPIWWTLVLGAMYYTKGDVRDKAKIGLIVVGAGAVIGVIYRNYKKDIKEIKREVIQATEPKVEFTGKSQPVKNGQYRSVMRRGNIIKFIA